jgi:hypothetical protein
MVAYKLTLAMAALAGLTIAAAGEARAQSAQCAGLLSELRGLGSGGGGSGTAKQRSRLAALERKSAAAGCGGIKLFGRPPACAAIQSQIRQVKSQMASGSGRADATRRRQIQAQLARLRCGQAPPAPLREARAPARDATAQRGASEGEYAVHNGRVVQIYHDRGTRGRDDEGSPAPRSGGLLTLLFGGGTRSAVPRYAEPAERRDTRVVGLSTLSRERRAARSDEPRGERVKTYGRVGFGGGSYRTLCVRSCDGYYFPISTVTHRSNFERDEAVCQALCPGTDVSLYAHPVGTESERMHSVSTGLPYEALPLAFQYRKAYDPACTCAFEAKMVTTAEGDMVIDRSAITAAYSPASMTDAARAIDEATGPANGTAPVSGDAPGEGDDARPVGLGAAAGPPGPTGPAAAGDVAAVAPPPADPSAAKPQAGGSAHGAAAVADRPAADAPGAVSTTAVRAPAPPPGADAAVPAGPAGASPQSEPIPEATEPPLRVRTIGPAFLADQ